MCVGEIRSKKAPKEERLHVDICGKVKETLDEMPESMMVLFFFFCEYVLIDTHAYNYISIYSFRIIIIILHG